VKGKAKTKLSWLEGAVTHADACAKSAGCCCAHLLHLMLVVDVDVTPFKAAQKQHMSSQLIKLPSSSCPMLPHGSYQVTDSSLSRAG
jgi:hypothetical protein